MMAAPMKSRVLVVEDDANLSAVLHENLTFEGFDVRVVGDGAQALEDARAFLPDLVVLDIMLPGMNGFELCGTLRRNGRTPVLILSARSDKNDKVRGLNLGADDYITKPFELEEFLARVHAVLRRARPATEVLQMGSVRINFRAHTAHRGQQEIHLTHREFDLLKYLSERAGRVVGRDELLRDLWEFPDPGLTRSVDHAIGRLRRKVEADPHRPRFIHTAVGHGYVMVLEGPPPDSASEHRFFFDGIGE
jgi:DNA-binding response OmpR family regulator